MTSPVDQHNRLAAEARSARLRAVIDEVLSRRAAGHAINESELVAGHAELMPELAEELRRLALIDGARRLSSAIDATLIVIRCPQCRHSLEIAHDRPRIDVSCSQCGAKLHLANPTSEAAHPERLGRFRLLSSLGSGSFGTVWRALDTQLEREVALKVPRRSLGDGKEIEEFLHEARVAAQLKHKHIVTVHEIGHADGYAFIVSDLIQGLPLGEWVQRRQLGFPEAAELCGQIAAALDHAHQAGVIHRDLKPANILIDTQGQPHLTDFGLALRATDKITLTTDGEILGTPAYMSPEQAQGDADHCDARSDVYSLGVILYELLTDELPFRGSSLMVIEQLAHDQPLPPRRLNRHIPRDLETICLKCLEKQPHRRYASAQALAGDLARFQEGRPIEARPTSALERAWRWCRRNPLVSGSLAAVMMTLIVISIAALALAHERQQQVRRVLELTVREHEIRLLEALGSIIAAGVSDPDLAARIDPVPSHARIRDFLVDRTKQASDALPARLKAPFDMQTCFVLDGQGKLLAVYPEVSSVANRDFSKRDYFQAAVLLAPGEVRVCRAYRSDNDGKYKIPISAPIHGKGGDKPVGVLVVSVSTAATRALDDHEALQSHFYVWCACALVPLSLLLGGAAFQAVRARRPSAKQS